VVGSESELEVTVLVWRIGKQYAAFDPISGVSGWGNTVDEALESVKKALEHYFEEKKRQKAVQPAEHVATTTVRVRVPVDDGKPVEILEDG